MQRIPYKRFFDGTAHQKWVPAPPELGQGLTILHPYKPAPPLSLAANPQVQADSFGCTIQGLPGIRVGIEQSLNLVDCQSWTNFILPATPLELRQAGASALPRQFYRAVLK